MAPSTRTTQRATAQAQEVGNAPQQVANFTLAPGLGNAEILDFNTSEAKDIFKFATKSIYSDTETKFDGSPEGLQNFLFHLKLRADSFGWNDDERILDIRVADGQVVQRKNLLENYGSITVDQVRQHSNVYVNHPTRNAQDSYMLHQAVFKSLDVKILNKIRHKTDEYTINGFVPGELFLRVVIREVYTDTNATLVRIHRQLQDLPKYMDTINNDVEKFNLYVEDLEAQLAARGHRSTELLTHLFTAYSGVKDSVFVRYIEAKQNDYDEGKDITTQELMATALAKFHTRKDAGLWEAKSAEQEQITALTVQLVQLRDKSKKASKKNKKGAVTQPSNNQPSSKKPDSKKKKKTPAWKLVPPTDEEKTAGSRKMVNGHWYNWCVKHNMWTFHTSQECKGVDYKPNRPQNNNSRTTTTAQETVIAPYVREE